MSDDTDRIVAEMTGVLTWGQMKKKQRYRKLRYFVSLEQENGAYFCRAAFDDKTDALDWAVMKRPDDQPLDWSVIDGIARQPVVREELVSKEDWQDIYND